MKVPYIDLTVRYENYHQELITSISDVIVSGRFIGGKKVDEIEQKIAALFGGATGIGVASGTDALTLSLQALNVQVGDEVIIPAVSFFATAGAVMRIGAIPVVVDVLSELPIIDSNAIQNAITPKTAAIIPVHLFGGFAEIPDFGIPIIDDSAQAVGGSPPRFQGELAVVSFYPTKVLGAFGDGGMVIAKTQELGGYVRKLANHGMTEPHLHHKICGHVGINSRLDSIQATILLCMLKRMEKGLRFRQQIAQKYDEAFPQLCLPKDSGTPIGVYIIRHPKRDDLSKVLHKLGVGTSIYYPRSLATQPCVPRRFATPNAEIFCRESLALPCYEGMSEEQVNWVIKSLLLALERL